MKPVLGDYHSLAVWQESQGPRPLSFLDEHWTDLESWRAQARAKVHELLAYQPPECPLDPVASAHVIDALARAFRLDRENHCHLRHLAGLPTPEPDQMPEGATPESDRLLAALMPAPACLLGPRFDFVAWNETFAALWDPGGLPEGRRNLMWLTFADPVHRRRWVD